MISYIFGFIYVLFSILLYQLLGECFVKKESDSYKFIIGFIIHSFFVAVLGIFVQIINLPWKVFFYGMILIFISEIFFLIYCIRDKKIVLNKEYIINYLKNNWFLYIGMGILTVYSLLHVGQLWSNNYTDDGYYISLMSSLPYTNNPFRIDPITGFKMEFSFERIINTFELEGSFFIFLTKMPGTLYARVFLSMLNHFIGLNAINAFFIKINKKNSSMYQYITTSIYLLVIENIAFILNTGGAWSIITAPYFGSSLVKVITPFIILLPLISINNLNITKIIITFMSCVVLVSKSSCAVPILYLLAIGYIIAYQKKWKYSNKWLCVLILVIITTIGVFIGDNLYLENQIYHLFKEYKKPIMLVLSLIIIILNAVINRNKESKRIIIITMISLLLTFVPYLNNLYEKLTIYDFVTERTWLTLWLFIVVVGIYYFINYIYKLFIENKSNFIKIIVTILLFISCCVESLCIGKNEYGGIHIRSSIYIYKSNKYIVPQSTYELGIKLNEYYNKYNRELKVIIDPGIVVDGYTHYSAAILRAFSPHIQSIIGGVRIDTSIGNSLSEFYGFDLDDLAIFDDFEINPSSESLKKLEILNHKYPFDCLIIPNAVEKHKKLLSDIGYYSFDRVYDNQNNFYYEIFIKD